MADSWLETLSKTIRRRGGGCGPHRSDTDRLNIDQQFETQVPQSTLAGTKFSVSAEYTTQSVNNQGQSDCARAVNRQVRPTRA